MTYYLCLPNRQNPKYALPLDNRKVMLSSFMLYTPLLMHRKVQIAILKKLVETRLIKYVLPSTLITESEAYSAVKKPRMLREQLGVILGQSNLACAFFYGTPGLSRKLTIQLMDRSDGRIVAYAKIADTTEGKKQLQHEHTILLYLRSLNIVSADIPRVIAMEESNGSIVLVQSPPSSNYKHGGLDLRERHVSFLAEIFSKSISFFRFQKSRCYNDLIGRLSRIFPNLHPTWCDRYREGLAKLEAGMGRIVIPFGLCHYDFKPWNVRQDSRQRIFVFDWELARKQWVPLYDVLHYITQPAILVKRESATRIFDKLINVRYVCSDLIQDYFRAIRLSSLVYEYLLLFYLCDVSCFYMEKQLKNDVFDRGDSYFLDTVGVMLDLYLQRVRSR